MAFLIYGQDSADFDDGPHPLHEVHQAFMDQWASQFVARGPKLSEDGSRHTGSVHVLDTPDPRLAQRFAFDEPYAKAGWYSDIAVSPFESLIEGICRWDTTDGSLDRVDDGSQVALSPDWSLIAGVGDDATVVLVDAESGDVVRELAGHHDKEIVDGSPIQDIAFSPDGTMLANAGLEGQVIVWSVEDGSKIAVIETGADVSAVSFSPDGARLATAGGAPVQVFDVPSGDLVSTLSDSPDASGLSWRPDSRWLAAAGPGGGPAVWRVEDFALTEELTGRSLKELAFAPDSRTLAVTDTEDDTVRLWTPKALGGTDRDVRELVGHTGEPGAVVFAPDSATLYSVAGTDGVFAWEVRTGKLAKEFELPVR